MLSCTSASSSFCWPQWEPEWLVKTGWTLAEVASDSWNDCHLCVVQVECKPGSDLWSWRSFPFPKLPRCFIRTELGLFLSGKFLLTTCLNGWCPQLLLEETAEFVYLERCWQLQGWFFPISCYGHVKNDEFHITVLCKFKSVLFHICLAVSLPCAVFRHLR